MNTESKKTRCNGRTKTGKPCRAAAMDSGLCFLHSNPNKAAELGRIGGQNSRYGPSESADPLPPMDTVFAVKARIERIADDLYSNKLSPKVAAVLVTVLTLQIRVLELTDKVTDTKQKVEKMWAEYKKRTGDADPAEPPHSDDPDDPPKP